MYVCCRRKNQKPSSEYLCVTIEKTAVAEKLIRDDGLSSVSRPAALPCSSGYIFRLEERAE
jgi:hypothetical protein